MHVDSATKQAVMQKLQEGLDRVAAKYSRQFSMPRVEFTKRGTTAGVAHYGSWSVNFNPVLLMENKDKFLATTVPHELAHLITDKVYPEAHRPQASASMMFARSGRRPKREPHGPQWQSVMRALGVANPTRCHSYDVSNAQTKVKSKYHYECKCFGDKKNHFVGPKVHAKIARGARYTCKKCRTAITLVQAVGKLTYQQARDAVKTNSVPKVKNVAPKVPAVKAPGEGSKMQQCYRWFKTYVGQDKDLIIAVFVNEVGMTRAGASTYYYQCKKLWEQGV